MNVPILISTQKNVKGKSGESRRRKAVGLKLFSYDCQVAEIWQNHLASSRVVLFFK